MTIIGWVFTSLKFCHEGLPVLGEISDGGYLEGGDFFPAGQDLCFIGVGLRSNLDACMELMKNDWLGTRRVAIVKDDFDQNQVTCCTLLTQNSFNIIWNCCYTVYILLAIANQNTGWRTRKQTQSFCPGGICSTCISCLFTTNSTGLCIVLLTNDTTHCSHSFQGFFLPALISHRIGCTWIASSVLLDRNAASCWRMLSEHCLPYIDLWMNTCGMRVQDAMSSAHATLSSACSWKEKDTI